VRTSRQAAGDAAEQAVARHLAASGWRILARNLHVGRAEIDLLAVDPGPPARLVAVEVRWRRRRDFGLPEETVDRHKQARLRAAVGRLVAAHSLPDGSLLPGHPPAIDIVVVEPGPGPAAATTIRHLRDALDG
jgi:putative endonuclease